MVGAHPNIVQYYDAWAEADMQVRAGHWHPGKTFPPSCVMELCGAADILPACLKDSKLPASKNTALVLKTMMSYSSEAPREFG